MSPVVISPYRLVTKEHTSQLRRILHATADRLRKSQAEEMLASRWDQNVLTRYDAAPLIFIPEEKVWLHTHLEVAAVSSIFNALFFLTGSDDSPIGIGPKLLALISLRTGIQFRYTDIEDSQYLLEALTTGRVLLTAPLI